MTRRTNETIAGIAFLFYIAIGLTALLLFDPAAAGVGTTAKLALMAERPGDVRIAVILSLLCCLAAFVLAVTLYRITCAVDRDIALLGLVARAAEGVTIASFLIFELGLLWLATVPATSGPDTDAVHTLAAFLFRTRVWSSTISATLFAAGSTFFAWLLLRGRMIPLWLAWLGVVASILLLIVLPAQLAGFAHGRVFQLVWLPMLVFEVVLAVRLIVRGTALPAIAGVPRA